MAASTSSSSVNNHPSPQELAQRMFRYTEIHEKFRKVVAEDPTRMKALASNLQSQGIQLPMVSGAISDPMATLKSYDEVMATEPKSYEDHYNHFSYAFSASVLVNLNILSPLAIKDPAFFKEYNKAFATLTNVNTRGDGFSAASHSEPEEAEPEPDQPSTPPTGPLISMDEANSLVDNVSLLQSMKFCSTTLDDDEGNWRILGVTWADEEEYQVNFEDCGNSWFPQTRREVIRLLTESVKV